MANAHLIDLVIALILLFSLYSGWVKGAIMSVLSTAGIVAGLIVGAVLAPKAMSYTANTGLRFLIGLGVIVLLVGLGNIAGGYVGSYIREHTRWRSVRFVDSAIGSVLQNIATLFVVWLIAIPLATTGSSTLTASIRGSAILGAFDKLAPVEVQQLPAKISAMLDDSGLPPMLSPFQDIHTTDVAAPKITVDDPELVEALRPSVIHVIGDASQCKRRLLGSGFVIDDNYVITNAHVVAGTESVTLDTTIGLKKASVVLYDPNEDLAVLYSPNLGIEPLEWAENSAATSQDTIVMGFPESGPFEAAPGRVREKLTINGPNIYATSRVDRQVYTVRGSIRQGNSGGPMVDYEGKVLGVVFGAAVDDTDTGYVLTADDVKKTIGDIEGLTESVSTQTCVAK
ncbi:MAG: MarP family serine protease [Corynebacterium sp.]|nr:MarP family serine protease [Corynebacterium sp.]